jgi:hypothetical protein
MHNTLAASDYGLLDEKTFAPRPNYWGALLWRHLMGSTVLDSGVPIQTGLHVYAHCQRGTPGGVSLLIINTDRNAPRSLMLPTASLRYTLEAASSRDADVRLNGRPLALDPGDELPPITGAPTTANTVTFKQATITFLAIPAAGNNTCRQLASNVYMGRICSHTARCGICFYLSKAVSFGHTATKKRAPGRDRLVPPCRFSMLDCDRCTQRSVGCLRRGF